MYRERLVQSILHQLSTAELQRLLQDQRQSRDERRQYAIWLSLQQMLTLVSSDMADGSEDVCAVSGTTFYAVSVVDSTLACLRIYVEMLQVVVEIHGTCAEVAAEEGGVCGEDGRAINAPLFAERDGHSGQPFVELSNDGALLLVEDVL